ncbi:hypothetical protein JKA74_15525 [Marivirga sp. S37H4]|uniref:Uncharacterized protein n=1 Tax=Marivirga aurantiaca TaxID=2802615 RepID=A0A935CA89_9BACT|nr:hypothetical protein [Marivirga aurantiaca]MBK6266455.1 hypothetical protein [Marivirga aurantiaca]
MFIISLLNVAFIPQLCLSAVQELNNKGIAGDLDDGSDIGLNIFEEESKEGHEENKTGGENFGKIFDKITTLNKFNPLFLPGSLSGQEYPFHHYTSLILTPLSPPPDLV